MNLEEINMKQRKQELECLERCLICYNIYKKQGNNQYIINILATEILERIFKSYELMNNGEEESLNPEIRKELIFKIYQHMQESDGIIIDYNKETHTLKGLYTEKGERIAEIITTHIHRDAFMHPKYNLFNEFSQTSLSPNMPISYILTDTELARANTIYSLGNHIHNTPDKDCFQEFKNAKQYLVRTFNEEECSSIMEVYPNEQKYIMNCSQYIGNGSYKHYSSEESGAYSIKDCKGEEYYITDKKYRDKIWPKKVEEAVYYDTTRNQMARILQRKK